MNRHSSFLIFGMVIMLLLGGCRTLRNFGNSADVAAARDLTFHGLNALHNGHPKQAETLLKQAADACPDDQRIRQHLASALVEQGEINSALLQLERAIENSPHDPRLYVEMGRLNLLKDQDDIAHQNAMIALKINRRQPEAWILRGQSEAKQGDLNSALTSFHRAASCESVDDSVYLEIARTYRQLNQPMQALSAIENYNSQFASDQVPVPGILLAAETLSELQQHGRAQEALLAATNRSDVTPEVWLALSRTQSLIGNTSGARLTARSAQHAFPNDARISSWLTELDQNDSESPSTQQTAQQTASLPITYQ